MKHRNILVIGGSGFVGRSLVAHLVQAGCRVRVPTRHRERARALILLPTVEVVEASGYDQAELESLMQGCDAVVNLVGVLHSPAGGQSDPWGPRFRAAHVDLVDRILKACQARGIRRLLHVSALGVTEGGEHTLPSRYLRSKAAGEARLRDARELDWTIFRPSVIFGPSDRFLGLFAALMRWLPVLALPRPEARFQPVFVGDVAAAMVKALDDRSSFGRIYELAGPRIYTLRKLVQLAGHWSGHRRPVIGMPGPLATLQAGLMEWAPGEPLMSRDNLASMSIDNIATVQALASEPGAEGVRVRVRASADGAESVTPSWPPLVLRAAAPTALEAVAPAYLRAGPHRTGMPWGLG